MDASAFAEIKDMMGDTFNGIITLCLQNFPEQLNDIENAIENRNAESLFHSSHKLKSACGSIGAYGLAEKAEAIELIGREGSTDVTEQTFNEFRDAMEQVLSILSTELNN